MVGLIGGYLSLLATGVLLPLNRYVFDGATLPQIPYILMGACLIGFALKPVIFGGGTIKDTLKTAVDTFQLLGGENMTENDAIEYTSKFGKQIGKQILNDSKSTYRSLRSKKITKVNALTETHYAGKFPPVEQRYRELQHQYLIFAVKEETTPQSLDEELGLNAIPIKINPAKPEKGTDLESEEHYLKRSFLILGGFIVVVILVNLISTYWGGK